VTIMSSPRWSAIARFSDGLREDFPPVARLDADGGASRGTRRPWYLCLLCEARGSRERLTRVRLLALWLVVWRHGEADDAARWRAAAFSGASLLEPWPAVPFVASTAQASGGPRARAVDAHVMKAGRRTARYWPVGQTSGSGESQTGGRRSRAARANPIGVPRRFTRAVGG
jgi:hypothetical protein